MPIDFSQPLPSDIVSEQVVLSGIALYPDLIHEVRKLIKPTCFSNSDYAALYSYMCTQDDKHEVPDLFIARTKTGVSASVVAEITNNGPLPKQVLQHATQLYEMHSAREQIKLYLSQAQALFDRKAPGESIKAVEDRLNELNTFEKENAVPIMDLARKSLEQMQQQAKSEGNLTGVPTGLTELDMLTNGWQKSDLIIVAARPGMGKTALLMNLAEAAGDDYTVALFSLEMSGVQLATRAILSNAKVNSSRVKNGETATHEWERIGKAVNNISEKKIFIDDTPAITKSYLRNSVRKLYKKHGPEFIMAIDYLQLQNGENKNREQEINGISQNLKAIAKEFDIPVIALSQLSRAVEHRSDKRPMLSDLRESGGIEQDADMVIFLYRPEYYNIMEDEDGNSTEGRAELIVAKHRSGALKTVHCKFEGKYTKFSDLDDSYFINQPPIESYGKIDTSKVSLPYKDGGDDDLPF